MEKMVSIGVFMKVVSIVSSPSFVCLSVSCLSYSLDVARYACKNKTDNTLNKQKNPHRINNQFGLYGE